MHMGNLWIIYWAIPNHKMEIRDRKGTHHHPFMRYKQNWFFLKEKRKKGQKVCLQNGCGSMLLEYSMPRSWRIKLNGEPLFPKHLVVGWGYSSIKIGWSSGKGGVVKIELKKSTLVVLSKISKNCDLTLFIRLRSIVLMGETLCEAGYL